MYENSGLAVSKLSWVEKGSTGEWKAEYFNNMTLGGTPALTRYDSAVNFDWGAGSPAAAIQSDHFSAHWTRTVDLTADMYTFSLTVDDGARFWVNGQLLVDAWYYEVFVFIPYRYTTTAQARYWVRHAAAYTLRIVNQSTQGERWVSLGTYYFNGGNSEYVSLAM
ncbi:MAG: PA14 domain-containing protein [Chloroflexota bacterium]|nr:PA14 domain-containing protein [Chloroflexota bacterium]